MFARVAKFLIFEFILSGIDAKVKVPDSAVTGIQQRSSHKELILAESGLTPEIFEKMLPMCS